MKMFESQFTDCNCFNFIDSNYVFLLNCNEITYKSYDQCKVKVPVLKSQYTKRDFYSSGWTTAIYNIIGIQKINSNTGYE